MDRTLFLLLVLLGSALPVHADQLGFVLNGRSIHLDNNARLNEANWGAGLEYQYTPNGSWIPFLTAAGFKDSENAMSYYAGGGVKHRFQLGSQPNSFYIDVGGVLFLMTREDYNDNRPFPGVLPVLTLGVGRFALNVTYVPPVQAPLEELMFFQLVYFIDLDPYLSP